MKGRALGARTAARSRVESALVALLVLATVASSCSREHRPDDAGPPSPGEPPTSSGSSTPRPPAAAPSDPGVEVVDLQRLPSNHLYPGHRPPLVETPLRPLPLGSVRPTGWLRTQLERQARGPFEDVQESDDAIGPPGVARLWFRSLVSLAHLLEDERLMALASRSSRRVLDSQEADGFFGPRADGSLRGPPPGVVLSGLRDYHGVSGDPRVVAALERYFEHQESSSTPEGTPPHASRGSSERLEAAYWLYDLTGDAHVLGLVDRLASAFGDPATGVLDDTKVVDAENAVDRAAAFRQLATFFQRTGDRRLLEAAEKSWRATVRAHGRVDGTFSGDDRLEAPASSRGVASSVIAETIQSFVALLCASGAAPWGDRLEKVAMNALAAAWSADLRRCQRYSQQNQLHITDGDQGFDSTHADDLAFGRPFGNDLLSAWPAFAAHLWLAAPGDGLAVVSYAPSRVRALVGEDEGVAVTLHVRTEYPFGDRVAIDFEPARTVRFPLALRIPSWCDGATVRLNRRAPVRGRAGEFLTLLRAWRVGDQLILELPMAVRASKQVNDSVSFDVGPLAFALGVDGESRPIPGPRLRPAVEILPAAPWNYGLLVDPADPDARIRRADMPEQPFDASRSPVVLEVKGRLVPTWRLARDSAAKLPASPLPADALDGPVEDLELVPYGSTKLRVALFPWR